MRNIPGREKDQHILPLEQEIAVLKIQHLEALFNTRVAFVLQKSSTLPEKEHALNQTYQSLLQELARQDLSPQYQSCLLHAKFSYAQIQQLKGDSTKAWAIVNDILDELGDIDDLSSALSSLRRKCLHQKTQLEKICADELKKQQEEIESIRREQEAAARRKEEEKKRQAEEKRKADEKAARDKKEKAEHLARETALQRQTEVANARLLQLQREFESELAQQQKNADARQRLLETAFKTALSQAQGAKLEAALKQQQQDIDARQRALEATHQGELKDFQDSATKRKQGLGAKQKTELQGAKGAELVTELQSRHIAEKNHLQKLEEPHKATLLSRHKAEKEALGKLEDAHKAELQRRKDEMDYNSPQFLDQKPTKHRY